ncbi:MAG TPA: hypothetical protein VGD52_16420 [Pseudoduganella sp.]
MRRRSEIGSVASGILHSFVSRNNDLEGYWGIGVLYLYARKVGELTVMLDLLRGTINPPAARLLPIYGKPNFQALIGQYKAMLYALLHKRNVPESWVAEAVFSIEFESKAAKPAYPKIGEDTAAFVCRLSIKDDLGRERVFRLDGWCWPHSPWRESRRSGA